MGVTPGKKSPKKTPKQKSPAESEPMETTVISPEKKTAKSPSNGLEKKSDSTKKKSLKRKLDDGDYEENTEEVKNSESVITEEDLNDSQKESGKKQKKKKHRVDSEENKSADSTIKKTGISSGDDDEEDKNIPSECRLFVTSIGLEGMTKNDLKDYFKSLGYSLVSNIKQRNSRHAFVGFATVKEAEKARESLDKTDCKGFPLSIDSKDLMLSALRLLKKKRQPQLINTDGSADCCLYVSPITPEQTKQKLMDSFIGVVNVVHRKGPKRNWLRLMCANSAVAKELHRSHQGKVVEGSALRLETTEEFRKRMTEEQNAKVVELRKKKLREQKMEKKKEKESKTKEKKSITEPKELNDGSDSEKDDDEDDVRVVNDDADSDEEEVVPKSKKAKGAAPKSKKAQEVQPKLKKAKVAGKR